jgi:hypothetical protein
MNKRWRQGRVGLTSVATTPYYFTTQNLRCVTRGESITLLRVDAV